jgi:vacuolar-type H+-ATPase subunit E/Vma4
MSKQDIVDRIIADAEEEAKGIIAEAQASADKLIADKNAECKALMEQTEGETAVKVKAIQDGKAATARLDGAKILLSAKRGVIDGIYEEAFSQLLRMSENDWLKLTATLLEKYAEQGDSIAFADGYPCAKGVYELPIVKDKKLKPSARRILRADLYLSAKIQIKIYRSKLCLRQTEKATKELSLRKFLNNRPFGKCVCEVTKCR